MTTAVDPRGAARNQVAKITLKDPTPPYKFIRFEATQTGGANLQVGEIEIFGKFGGLSIPAVSGVVVGAAIDWWMTARFQEQLENRCNAFIDSVQVTLITGTRDKPGVEPLLAEAVRVTDAAQRRAIHDVLVQKVNSP